MFWNFTILILEVISMFGILPFSYWKLYQCLKFYHFNTGSYINVLEFYHSNTGSYINVGILPF